tara:strand:- start:1024 stop:1269 length:246 start_codon:yes stop_codon:yes gene_type:complete
MTIYTSGYADTFYPMVSSSQPLSNTMVRAREKKSFTDKRVDVFIGGKIRKVKVRKTEKVSTARIDGENLKVLQDWKRREKK